MATKEESRHCLICDKLFCCEDCCTNHIKKKHPNIDVDCSLCRNGLLLIKNFNDDKFLCHVIFNHLPLKCNKCGKLFKNSSDLNNLGCCINNLLYEKSTIISNKLNQSLDTISTNIKTPINLIKFKSQLFANEQKNFTSPQQFSRQTSTPMQTPMIKKNESPTSSSSASVSASSSPTLANNKLIVDVTSPSIINNTNCESIDRSNDKSKINDKTPLKSILIHDDDSKYSSKYKIGRKLSSMEELDETSEMELTDPCESILPIIDQSNGTANCESDMELTDPFDGVLISESNDIESPKNNVSNINNNESVLISESNVVKSPINNVSNIINNQSESKESDEKVEFIDQSNDEINNTNVDEDDDDYFDAYQSISEHSSSDDNNMIKIEEINDNNLSNIEYEKKIETTISVHKSDDNKNSKVKMIMMIIEKNIDTSVSDLTPYIESGLRKLDKLSSSNVVINQKSKCNNNIIDNNNNNNLPMYIDTWQSTSKIETLVLPKSTSTLSPIKNNNEDIKNDGLFSTVTSVIKNTIRGLTNINTDNKKFDVINNNNNNNNNEPSASSTICINSNVLPSTSYYYDGKNNRNKIPSLASNLLSKLKKPGSPFLAGKSMDLVSSTTGKRRREEYLKHQKLLSDCDNDIDDDYDNNNFPDEQVNSPLHKRKKTWNFRSREPISRMKSFEPINSFD